MTLRGSYMIKIGITGHRVLDEKVIKTCKLKFFEELNLLKNKYSNIVFLSPLADGADRLVVFEAIKLNIEFIAVLPMSKDEYKKDFNDASTLEFDYLLTKAKKIITLPNSSTCRELLYEKVGYFVSDNCDMLFALWDGTYTGLKGGTSEIVKYYCSKKNYFLYHFHVSRSDIVNNNMVRLIKYKKERL